MAKGPRRKQSIDELKVEIARSRDRITRDLRVFRREIDIPRRIKRSFQRQTAAWVTAAVVIGAILILLPARRKIVKVEPKMRSGRKSQGRVLEAGAALAAVKFAATLLRPVITSFITKKVNAFVNQTAPPKRAVSEKTRF
jgi:hypothetical protein